MVDGADDSPEFDVEPVEVSGDRILVGQVLVTSAGLEVDAGAEAPAGAGDDDGPHVRVAVEEDLVELGDAGHLHKRPHLDAGLAHVEHEHRDPSVFGGIEIRAGQEDGDIGGLGP